MFNCRIMQLSDLLDHMYCPKWIMIFKPLVSTPLFVKSMLILPFAFPSVQDVIGYVLSLDLDFLNT